MTTETRDLNDLLQSFQRGETTEAEILEALGASEGTRLRVGENPDKVDACVKPELYIKILSLAFYTRKQGRISAYIKFEPVNSDEWEKAVEHADNQESGPMTGQFFLSQ